MYPLYNNTEGRVAYNGTTSLYRETKNDAFFVFELPVGLAAATVFEVWCAPLDTTAPLGVCRPNVALEYKKQFAAPSCPGYATNPSGDLLIKLAAPAGPVAADQIKTKADSSVNVRLPQCGVCDFVTLKPVGSANGITAVLITNSHARS